MCLLGIAFRQFKDAPLLILANREEFYARPTAGPQYFPRQTDTPAWLGGIDLRAGGTWLGVNESGLLVAVTNRQKNALAEMPLSRGLLCRSLLAQRETAAGVAAALRALEADNYAGCNLLIADRDNATVIEAVDVVKTTPLAPGLHLIANGELNALDDLRIQRVRREFQRVNPIHVDAWLREAQLICQLPAQGNEPAICLTGADRGTVSSTVLSFGQVPETVRYWYAPASPLFNSYDDYSPMLLQLLRGEDSMRPADDSRRISPASSTFLVNPPNSSDADIEPPDDSPARRAVRHSLTYRIREDEQLKMPVRDSGRPPAIPRADALPPHRIFLRGPWQAEPLARADNQFDGTRVWSHRELPAAGTVRLPAAWQILFGDFRGRVRFSRRFHPPSNVTPDDRLSIVLDGIRGSGSIYLNGEFLGKIEIANTTAKFDVTGKLQINSTLQIELEFTETSPAASAGGLFASVALEIESQ